MKKCVAGLILIAVFCSLLFSCGSDLVVTETADTPQSPTEDQPATEVLADRLTPEAVEAFPMATSRMSTEELRDLCVDFFRFSQTFVWTPSETLTLGEKAYSKGGRYGGFPYLTNACGNVYRLLDCIDPATGIMTVTPAMKSSPELFFNQCAWGAFWGWGRVVNSADYYWTATMTQKNGFLPVGPYTYDASIESFQNQKSTTQIILENGNDVMFASYAALHKADGVVNYITGPGDSAGHVMMVAEEPTVVQNGGVIDARQSFVKVHHQFSTPLTRKDSEQKTYHCEGRVDEVFTFEKLVQQGYLPFTFAEFLGTDPVEPGDVSISLSSESVTPDALIGAVVRTNYLISDLSFDVTDTAGKSLLSFAFLPDHTQIRSKTIALSEAIALHNQRKVRDRAGKDANVCIKARLSTGEIFEVLRGVLTA